MVHPKACLLIAFIIFGSNATSGQTDASDQRIWAKGRAYVYLTNYQDSSGNLLSSEQVIIEPTGKVWDLDPKQTLANYHIAFSESTRKALEPYPLNGVHKTWRSDYQEGVIENETKVWMHPLRSNQYVLTELAPFPEVRFPIGLDSSWSSTLWVYKAFGTFEGTIESNYKVTGKVDINIKGKSIPCWQIESVGIHDRLGKNTLVTLFNEQAGFVRLEYQFFNGNSILMELADWK